MSDNTERANNKAFVCSVIVCMAIGYIAWAAWGQEAPIPIPPGIDLATLEEEVQIAFPVGDKSLKACECSGYGIATRFKEDYSQYDLQVRLHAVGRFAGDECQWPGCKPDIEECYVVLNVTPRSAIPTRAPTPRPVSRKGSIYVGMPADDVHDILGKGTGTRVIGRDAYGLIVEWHYPDAIYTMRLRTKDGVECYRVTKIQNR